MKLYRVCAVVIVAVMLLSSVIVSANEGTVNIDIDNITFDVIVRGTFDDSTRNWVDVVISEGKITSDEYMAFTMQDKLTKTKYLKQRSFEAGEYTFTAGLDFNKGWYTAMVNYDGIAKPLFKNFYYYTPEDMENAVKEFNRINALADDGAVEMKKFLNNNIDGIFSDFEYYISLSEASKAEVSEYVKNLGPVTSISEIKAIVEKEALTYIVCEHINNEKFEDANTMLTQNFDLLKLKECAETSTYINKDEEFKHIVLEYLKDSNNSNFITNFREQVILTEIEKVDNSERITDILLSMSTSLNIDIDKYMSYTKKSKVNSEIAGNKYKTAAELINTINKFIDDAQDSSGGGGSLGSGGGKTGSVKVGNSDVASINISELPVFNDVTKAHWAYDAISTLKKNGIVSGYGDNTFVPDNKITRAEFVKMAITAFGLVDSRAVANFNDVNVSDWSYPYIASAQKYGIVNGSGSGEFLPNINIKREEAATIIYRIATFKGYAFSNNGVTEEFADFEEISDYARNAVSALKRYNILVGSEGNFNPKSAASRAEIAQIIYNLIKNLQLN